MDKQKLEQLTSEFCDKYCQYPNVCANEETLETVCDKCPMNEMFELLDDNNTTGAVTVLPEIKTNLDRLKARSVDELAEYIYHYDDALNDKICKQSHKECPFGEDVKTENCINCVKRWIEAEVDTE